MRIPLLALAFVALCAIPSHAQDGSWINLGPWQSNSHGPTRPLAPAANPNPAFPLRVAFKRNDHHFNYFWSDFRGQGELIANNTTYNFRYECPDTFRRRSEFQARWSKDGKKLDILLQKPDSGRTETCTLKIIDHS